MPSLAALRYRDVLQECGGPISALETGRGCIVGEKVFEANAELKDGLVPRRKTAVFAAVDGTGTHRVAAVARHMAVSEAMERWALIAEVQEGLGQRAGLGVDPTSNGMAAFPGAWARQARRFAWREAVERWCVFGWWEGRLRGEFRRTGREGISAVRIIGPFPEMEVVVVFSQSEEWRSYAYGTGAGRSFEEGRWRGMVEMDRHRRAVEGWNAKCGGAAANTQYPIPNTQYPIPNTQRKWRRDAAAGTDATRASRLRR